MATAIVTGGSRGLGRALVEALAERGWRVVTTARTAADLERAWPADGDHAAEVVPIAGDVPTRLQKEAVRGEDISDRPPPEESVPGFLALIEGSHPSGRYAAREAGAPAR